MTNLFFDLDGTLMVNPFWEVVFPAVTKLLGAAAGRPPQSVFNDIMTEHDARMDSPLPDRARTMNWDDIFQTIAAHYGVPLDFSAEETVRQHAAPPYTSVLDNAREVLQSLRANGSRKLVVASMGLSIYQVPVLKALGLYDLFDDFLMPDITGHLKTEREFYRAYLGNPSIHIGDRYDHDCVIPQSFGAKTILRIPSAKLADYSPFERPQHLAAVRDEMERMPGNPSVLPDAIVIHLSELPAVVETLERG